MKSIVTILAASALLSGGLVVGLAAANGASASAARPSVQVRLDAPAATLDTACRDAAWPYRPALCPGEGETPVRKVRVIPAAAPVARR